MNKLLILTSFLFIFSMKINAYEYIVYKDSTQIRIYYDSQGKLFVKKTNINGDVIENNNSFQYFMRSLNGIQKNQTYYINKHTFDEILSNDLNLLNDFYTQQTQAILNYYYNYSNFDFNHFIVYKDYELLYNFDGLAVESIVNGVWRGLYSSSDKSGYLYDKKGNLAYIDGVEPSFFEKLSNKFLKPFKFHLESIFIKKIWYSILVFIFAVVILRTVIRMAFQAFLIRFYDNKIQRLEKRREKIENA